jgi:hypothetical protein
MRVFRAPVVRRNGVAQGSAEEEPPPSHVSVDVERLKPLAHPRRTLAYISL